MTISATNPYASPLASMTVFSGASACLPAISTAAAQTSQTSAGQTSAGQAGSGGVQSVDFSNMTRQGLINWVNSQVTSGAMSVKDSSPFLSLDLSLTPNQLANGQLANGQTGLDDTQPVDFLSLAQANVAWAQKTGNTAAAQAMQGALDTMQGAQGQVTKVNITA